MDRNRSGSMSIFQSQAKTVSGAYASQDDDMVTAAMASPAADRAHMPGLCHTDNSINHARSPKIGKQT